MTTQFTDCHATAQVVSSKPESLPDSSELSLADLVGVELLQREFEFIVQQIRDLYPSTAEKLNLTNSVNKLTNFMFNRLYEIGSPTLCIIDEDRGLPGASHIAFAMARKKISEGRSGLNVIFASETLNDLWKDPNTGDLYITAGAFVDCEGSVFFGQFPHPIRIDLIETPLKDVVPRALLDEVNTSTVTPITSKIGQTISWDKHAAKSILTHGDIYIPKHELLDKETPQEAIIEAIRNINERSPFRNGFVIKPTCMAQGVDVFLFDFDTTPEAAITHIQTVIDRYGSCIVEERIPSILYRDPETQKPLDMNLRVLATSQGVVDIEIRAGEKGTPINKSIGAAIHEFDIYSLYDELGDHDIARATYDKILSRLDSAVKEYGARSGCHFMGLDVILYRTGDALDPIGISCIELNFGRVGGFGSLAEIRYTLDERILATKVFGDHLAQIASSIRKSSAEPCIHKESLTPILPIPFRERGVKGIENLFYEMNPEQLRLSLEIAQAEGYDVLHESYLINLALAELSSDQYRVASEYVEQRSQESSILAKWDAFQANQLRFKSIRTILESQSTSSPTVQARQGYANARKYLSMTAELISDPNTPPNYLIHMSADRKEDVQLRWIYLRAAELRGADEKKIYHSRTILLGDLGLQEMFFEAARKNTSLGNWQPTDQLEAEFNFAAKHAPPRITEKIAAQYLDMLEENGAPRSLKQRAELVYAKALLNQGAFLRGALKLRAIGSRILIDSSNLSTYDDTMRLFAYYRNSPLKIVKEFLSSRFSSRRSYSRETERVHELEVEFLEFREKYLKGRFQ